MERRDEYNKRMKLFKDKKSTIGNMINENVYKKAIYDKLHRHKTDLSVPIHRTEASPVTP